MDRNYTPLKTMINMFHKPTSAMQKVDDHRIVPIPIMAVALLLISIVAAGQSQAPLSIEDCNTMARNNYPLIKQMELIGKAREYSVENASRGYLPQISMAGQASYQSAVTTFPGASPSSDIPVLSKDQYKIYAEISQSLTDGYTIRQQKDLINANAAADEQKLEVDLYKLEARINQLFFGILLIDAQLNQAGLLKKDIGTGISKTEASIANGTALKSSAQVLIAESLKADQSIVTLKANRKGYADMLSLFINQPIDENTELFSPLSPSVILGNQQARVKALRFSEKQHRYPEQNNHLKKYPSR